MAAAHRKRRQFCKDRHCLALKRRAPVEIAGQRHCEGFRPFEGGTCASHSRRLPRPLLAPVPCRAGDALREPRSFRREIASALSVSRNTLAALECGGGGLVATLEAYGGAIGAGLYLALVGEERAFFAPAGNSSAHHGWQTPVALAAMLMQAVGGFDLDPCAATADRRRVRVKARVLLTAEDDGLTVPWRGRVFVNPPYGRVLKPWARKCASEAAAPAGEPSKSEQTTLNVSRGPPRLRRKRLSDPNH